MGQRSNREKLFIGIIKVNTYSLILALITGLATSLIIGMISFVIFLHVIALLPVLLDLESFSEKKIVENLWKVLQQDGIAGF